MSSIRTDYNTSIRHSSNRILGYFSFKNRVNPFFRPLNIFYLEDSYITPKSELNISYLSNKSSKKNTSKCFSSSVHLEGIFLSSGNKKTTVNLDILPAKEANNSFFIALNSTGSYNLALPHDIHAIGFLCSNSLRELNKIQKSGTYFLSSVDSLNSIYNLNDVLDLFKLENIDFSQRIGYYSEQSSFIRDTYNLIKTFALSLNDVIDLQNASPKNTIFTKIFESLHTSNRSGFMKAWRYFSEKIISEETKLEKTPTISEQDINYSHKAEYEGMKSHLYEVIYKNQQLADVNKTLTREIISNKEALSFKEEYTYNEELNSTENTKTKDYSVHAQSIINEFNLYQQDLVKMMELPVLADVTDPKVSEFSLLCEDILLNIEDNEVISRKIYIKIKTAYKNLLTYAHTVQLTSFNNINQQKLKDARIILAKTLNDESTLNEKEISAKALISKLTGIMPLKDTTIRDFRLYAGLRELEK